MKNCDCKPVTCNNIDPSICEPPPNTTDPKQLIVIDNNGCYRMMQDVTDRMSLLVKDSNAGNLRFVNGSEDDGKGIYLGDVTQINTGVTHIIGVDPTTKNAKATRPSSDTQFPAIPHVINSAGNIIWGGLKTLIFQLWDIVGDAYGVFTRNSSGDLVVVDGDDGDVLTKVNGEWTAGTITLENTSSIVPYVNLVIQRATTTTYTVSAHMFSLVGVTGDWKVLGSADSPGSYINLSGTINATGVNGIDTGSVTANTWYYIYVIFNPTVGTTSTLLSTSATAPFLPTGYQYYRNIGTLFVNSSLGIRGFFQNDKRTIYTNVATAGTGYLAEGDETTPQNTDFVSIDMSKHVPPNAVTWVPLVVLIQNIDDAIGASVHLEVTHSSGSNFFRQLQCAPAPSSTGITSLVRETMSSIPIISTQTAYWHTNTVSTDFTAILDIAEYEIK